MIPCEKLKPFNAFHDLKPEHGRRPWENHIDREDLKVGAAKQGNEGLRGGCILQAQLPSVAQGCGDAGMGSLGS